MTPTSRIARAGMIVAALLLVASGCAVARVSVSSSGTEGNVPSSTPLGVTDDGRYSLFASAATNLIAGDTNGWPDVFRRDEVSKTTVRVDVTNAGAQIPFGSATAAMTADGRQVAFVTTEPITGPTGGAVYVRDLAAGTTTLVSVPPAGGFPGGSLERVAISADGRYVSFLLRSSGAGGGPEGPGDMLYRSDRQAGTTVALTDFGRTSDLLASRDGKHFSLYQQCAHGCFAAPELLDADGSAAAWPALQFKLCWADDVTTISPDGRFVGYTASGFATDPACLAKGNYLIDRSTGAATPFSGYVVGVARDGRAVLYAAAGDALPGGNPTQRDLYLRDRVHGTDAREDFTVAGQLPDAGVTLTALSDDGTAVAFVTPATNVVAGDQNGVDDVFVRQTGMTPSS